MHLSLFVPFVRSLIIISFVRSLIDFLDFIRSFINIKLSALFSGNADLHTVSSQTLFISIFYMDFTWICNTNVIMRSRTSIGYVPEKVFLEESTD